MIEFLKCLQKINPTQKQALGQHTQLNLHSHSHFALNKHNNNLHIKTQEQPLIYPLKGKVLSKL